MTNKDVTQTNNIFTQNNGRFVIGQGQQNLKGFMIENMINRQIYDWLETHPYMDMLNYVQSRVIGQEEVATIVTNIYAYLSRMVAPVLIFDEQNRTKITRNNTNNMILCAPSGCGKTETYRALKDYFAANIPLLMTSISDVSNITATGFRGPDPASIVEPFAGLGSSPVGIVFLDEFDKICTPSFSAERTDVHLDVQHNLLTIIEGSSVETKRGFVDTSNLLFVGIGSFDNFRKNRTEKNKAGIGFNQEANKNGIHSTPIQREDMISSGGCYELIGRFSYIVNYHELNRDVLLQIIEKTKNTIANDFNCEINLDSKMIDFLCESANSKFGCRLLDSLMRDPILKAYSESLRNQKDGDVLVITLKDKDIYHIGYRKFTDTELLRQQLYRNPFNDETNKSENEPRMSFEETLAEMFRQDSV